MAIGACVLGNSIMGIIITINGRMGATVGRCHPRRQPKLAVLMRFKTASHSFSSPCPHAFWLLLQLLCGPVSLCSCHRVARVSLIWSTICVTLVANQRYTVSKQRLAVSV